MRPPSSVAVIEAKHCNPVEQSVAKLCQKDVETHFYTFVLCHDIPEAENPLENLVVAWYGHVFIYFLRVCPDMSVHVS